MSTRALIGMYIKEMGKYFIIYCQEGGEIEYTGKILNQYYTTETRIIDMLKQGDIRYLDKRGDMLKNPHLAEGEKKYRTWDIQKIIGETPNIEAIYVWGVKGRGWSILSVNKKGQTQLTPVSKALMQVEAKRMEVQDTKTERVAQRAVIAIRHPKTEVIAGIISDTQGELSKLGVILYNNYKTESKIYKLIRGGNAKVVKKNISTQKQHSREKPEPNTTIYYKRDMGCTSGVECFVEYSTENLSSYWNRVDVIYLYTDGEWYVLSQTKSNKVNRIPLKWFINKMKEEAKA